jgi:SpoVK/Ycf46/Vps4 family AAA+-type ATPase
LFRGPSGTGKSMAAAVIGRETGFPIYQVDLSAVVSKYIGDTEKNLRRVFDAANSESAILYFDEADALMTERTDAKDSHDRHANAEIAYLLRKLEPFEGLAILASNSRENLDEDVVTRLDGIVEFPMPDAATRERLWRSVLSSVKLEQANDVDIARLARDYELSGAEILRSVRIAALLSASDSRAIDMDLLQHSAAERVTMRERPGE